MEVGQITMEREDAREQLRTYRRFLHQASDQEYQMAAQAYRHLAAGKPLVSLQKAFAIAPLDDVGRPKLAIARADERQVQMSCHLNARSFGPAQWMHPSAGRARSRRVPDPRSDWKQPDGYAIVPMIPPDIRGKRDLSKHWILWEVEQWADKQLLAEPDRDPLLLRQVHGDLYVVEGAWDLTEVERLVMASLRR